MELSKSENLNELAEALAKAELEFEQITKETNNPHFNRKYADMASLISGTRPALAKHGITIVQVPRLRGQQFVEVTTMILHSSGQFMACDLMMPGGQRDRFDAQTVGSAITYARRYAYQSMLNIAGEDDDGNAASGNGSGGAEKSNGNGHKEPDLTVPAYFEKPNGNGSRLINATEKRAFWSAVKTAMKSEQDILDYFGGIGIEKTDEMKHRDFDAAMKWAVTL